jgi:hypothetical protein
MGSVRKVIIKEKTSLTQKEYSLLPKKNVILETLGQIIKEVK